MKNAPILIFIPLVGVISLCIFAGFGCRTVYITEQYVRRTLDTNAPPRTFIETGVSADYSCVRFTPFTVWRRYAPPYGLLVHIYVFDEAYESAKVRSVVFRTSDGIVTSLAVLDWESTVRFEKCIDRYRFKEQYPKVEPREAVFVFHWDAPLSYATNSVATLTADGTIRKTDGTETSWACLSTFGATRDEESVSLWAWLLVFQKW